MRSEDTTVPMATQHLDAAHDEVQDFERLEHLAEHTSDPALRRELEASIAGGQASMRRLRAAWDRLWMVVQVGR